MTSMSMEPTDAGTQPEGLQINGIEGWYRSQIADTRLPLHFERLAGGHSNLTYRVTDGAGQVTVLRRPPEGELLASAHDMSREYRAISALGPTDVPVPAALAFCGDPAVTGAPFYVMGFVAGRVLHEDADVEQWLTPAARQRNGQSLVEVAAALHGCDIDAIGLGELGRRDGYVGRQLRRWYRQYQDSGGNVALMDELHDRLTAQLPRQQHASLVHGDYRLGNCISAADGNIAAVLDWEICTLGDPLADLGYLLAMWVEPVETFRTTATCPSSLPGFPTRAELTEHYGRHSPLDLSEIGVYVGFSFWKVACINQGVWARYAAGQKAAEGVDVEAIGASVATLAELADSALGG